MRIVEQIHGDEYFAEAVDADGPWEAKFIFCGTYGFSPDKVKVLPEICFCGGKYWCWVGTATFPSAKTISKQLDFFGWGTVTLCE